MSKTLLHIMSCLFTEVVYINMKHIIQDATHPIFDIIQIVVELVSTQNIALKLFHTHTGVITRERRGENIFGKLFCLEKKCLD